TNLPVLGYLFGQKNNSNTDNELLMVLIPHILRAPDLSAMGNEPVLAGTERFSKVGRRPQGTPVSANQPLPVQPSTIPVTPPTPLTPAANPIPPAKPPLSPPSTPPPNRPPGSAEPHSGSSSPGQP